MNLTLSKKRSLNRKKAPSFFEVKPKTWQKIGLPIDECKSIYDVINSHELNFNVEKKPLLVQLSETNYKPILTHFSTVRTDTNQHLGVVGKNYTVIQNKEAFSFFDDIIKLMPGIEFETAGIVNDGARIFITAKLPSYMRIKKDDIINNYLFVTTSHDSTSSIVVKITPIRVACENTLNAALHGKKNSVRIRHTTNANIRMRSVAHIINLANEMQSNMENIFNSWANIEITDSNLRKFIELSMCSEQQNTLDNSDKEKKYKLSSNLKTQVNNVYSYAKLHPSQNLESTKGTLFGAYNAISGYYQNIRNYKTDSDKFNSLYFGGTAEINNQRAFNLCMQYSKNNQFFNLN